MQSAFPSVPERASSLQGHVTKDEEVLFLAGRKPYTHPPAAARHNNAQLTISVSSSSLTSEGTGFPSEGAGVTMDRIFNGSSVSLAISEDSTSILSGTSDLVGGGGGGAHTPESTRRNLLRPMSLPGGQGQGSVKAASRPESPNPPAGAVGGVTRSRSAHVHKPLRGTRSTPPPIIEEGSGLLDQISEESGSGSSSINNTISSNRHSLIVPTSPTSSLSTSPQLGSKKRRVAQSRRSRNKTRDADSEQGGAGEGDGGGAEGLSEHVSHVRCVLCYTWLGHDCSPHGMCMRY